MVKCGKKCEIWDRVVGYYRPTSQMNIGKKSEKQELKRFSESTSLENPLAKKDF